MRRVLVTGSEGYIGSVLMPLLRAAGYEPVGMDVSWYTDAQLLPARRSWTLIEKDIRDVEARDLSGYWAVVHLAALSNDPVGALEEQVTYDVNLHATIRLAELARKQGIQRFVYSSSCSMYGASGGELVNETASLAPQTAYARSKVLAEEAIVKLASRDFSPTYLRNATAFGISPRQRFDLVLPNLSAWAHTTGDIRLESDGTPWRPLVHIRDIIQAVLCTLAAPTEAVHNEAFNIGSNCQNFRVREIAGAVRSEYPQARLTLGPSRGGADRRSYRVDFTKALTKLPGFRPLWSLQQGARECADTFRIFGLTSETFQHRTFTRLKQLRYLMETGQLDNRLRWRSQRQHAA